MGPRVIHRPDFFLFSTVHVVIGFNIYFVISIDNREFAGLGGALLGPLGHLSDILKVLGTPISSSS